MKRIALYITSAVVLLGVTGCGKDFLTREPKLSQSTELTLSTYEGLNKATLGAYYYLTSNSWLGTSWVLSAEMRSGNGMKSDAANSNRYTSPYTWNYTETSTSGVWAYCYYTAAEANNVIDNLEGKATGDVTEQDLNNLKAECLFLRALAHFCCVLTYGQPYTLCNKDASYKESLGVPYVYHTDPNGLPARETVISNYENIVKDLVEAEEIIDPAYVRSGVKDKTSCVNLQVIQALLSRVYLYMGEWQKSADYATKVINSGKYKLWSKEEYKTVWTEDTGSGEVIFEVYGSKNNDSYGSWEDISYITNPDGSGDTQAAKPLLSLYKEGDVRGELYRTDKNGETGVYWTTKYAGKGAGTPDCNNVIFLRLSEMYLNRAEAAMRGASTGTTAVKDINAIASIRGGETYNSVGQTDIEKERRLEFAWEGLHLYDLARWGEKIERSASDYPLCTANLTIDFPSYHWALPIPKREIDLNKNLEQNPLKD